MANKFLGLDSINVLTSYIDQAVLKKTENSLVLTIQAYKYVKFGEDIITPSGGGFNFNLGGIQWPDGWCSLDNVLNKLIENGTTLEDAFFDGAIYVSSAVVTSSDTVTWSTPMRMSGQNGVSVKFSYAYTPDADESTRTKTPQGVNVDNRIEYVWTKEADGEWTGPTIWAMYSQDASDVLWRYCTTKDLVTPEKPGVGNPKWSSNLITQNLSKEYPYMWMSSQIVPAGQTADESRWTEPILFGHWGMDGHAPNYNITLYKYTEGYLRPKSPIFAEGDTLETFRANNPDWFDVPNDDAIENDMVVVDDDTVSLWWQCTINIDGATLGIISIGNVERYTALDGTAKPGQFTKFVYKWFETQTLPDGFVFNADEWNSTPDIDDLSNLPESSLWMSSATVSGINASGEYIIGEWSAPVKITGPRGPISYDYRVEIRYNIGTATTPKSTPDKDVWHTTPPNTTATYPYVWAIPYLVCYKMKYGDTPNEDGSYPIVEDGMLSVTPINPKGYFRLSGLNGEDGNKKNSIVVTSEGKEIKVTNFAQSNLYISNAELDTIYQINLDQLSFIDGYTGKFSNIGKGNMIINTKDTMKFVGTCTTATSITLAPQESVELVCYNNEDKKELLVIGKSL